MTGTRHAEETSNKGNGQVKLKKELAGLDLGGEPLVPDGRPARRAAAAAQAAIANAAATETDGPSPLAPDDEATIQHLGAAANGHTAPEGPGCLVAAKGPSATRKRKMRDKSSDDDEINVDLEVLSTSMLEESSASGRVRRAAKLPTRFYESAVAADGDLPQVPPTGQVGNGRVGGTNLTGHKPATLEDASSDIPSLIAMAAACKDLEGVIAAIDSRLPAYRGNNIHARLLRQAFSALRLGAFTMRKPSVELMAKKLFLLSGKMGQQAACEAAESVGVEHLPDALKQYGTLEPPVITSASSDRAIGKYFPTPARRSYPFAQDEPLYQHHVLSASLRPSAPRPVIDRSMYDPEFVELACHARRVMDLRRGETAHLPRLLKTGMLAGRKIRYQSRAGVVLLTGKISPAGTAIICDCKACGGTTEISPTDFEVHAGSGERRPADHLYLDAMQHSVRDLLTLALADAWAAVNSDVNMDVCYACRLGGDLLCCDGCTAAYHLNCAGLHEVPAGDWLCNLCNADTTYFAGSRSSSRGRGRGRGRGRSRGRSAGRGRGRTSRSSAMGSPGGRVHMLAPSAQRRHGGPPRNQNKNKRLFEAGTEGGLIDGEQLRYIVRGQVILTGAAALNPSGNSGILCHHCGKVVSCSQFEAHAGHSQRRQPYENIFNDSGKSLKMLAAALPDAEGGEGALDEDVDGSAEDGLGSGCVLCHDPSFSRPGEGFGNRTMLICDQCEREFHVGCLVVAGLEQLDALPEGDWFCSSPCGHIHGLLRQHVAAGQIPVELGPDKRPKSLLGVALTQNAEAPVELRMDVLPAEVAVQAEPVPDANDVNMAMGLGKENGAPLEELTAAVGYPKEEEGGIAPESTEGPEVPKKLDGEGAYTWQLMNGRDGHIATTYAIKAAQDILQESFDPIVDLSTNTDLLPLMLQAKQYRDWDYRGVYTLLLRYRGKPVVAATARMFGPQMAELPLIATRSAARRQGHARVLFDLFLELLREAGVHRLVLPAAHETIETWKRCFGFGSMPESEVTLAHQQLRILVFPGSEMLWREVGGTPVPVGHHVLKPLPTAADVAEVKSVLQDLVTMTAVAAGEEEPPPLPPPPEPAVLKEGEEVGVIDAAIIEGQKGGVGEPGESRGLGEGCEAVGPGGPAREWTGGNVDDQLDY